MIFRRSYAALDQSSRSAGMQAAAPSTCRPRPEKDEEDLFEQRVLCLGVFIRTWAKSLGAFAVAGDTTPALQLRLECLKVCERFRVPPSLSIFVDAHPLALSI